MNTQLSHTTAEPEVSFLGHLFERRVHKIVATRQNGATPLLSYPKAKEQSNWPELCHSPVRKQHHPMLASITLNKLIVDRIKFRNDFSRLPSQSISAGGRLQCGATVVDRLPYIESGGLHGVLRLNDEGLELVTITFRQGELALLGALFHDEVIMGDLIATSDSKVRWIGRQDLEVVLTEDKELMLLTLKFFSQVTYEVRCRERIWLHRGATERVSAALARVAVESPLRDSGSWTVNITHDQLALRSGITRPKVSGALKKLEKLGLVRLGRGVIEIVEYKALAGTAGMTALA